jgi:hypothetical protein
MITPRRSLALLSIVAVLACSGDGAGGDESAWKTETTQVGDTTVVRTTGVRAEDAALRLVPEWSVGSLEGDGNYTFGSIKEFAVGPANEVFIFDGQYVALRQYDSTGKFIRNIGGKGTGPGEYERVNGIAVHEDGRLVMWNATNATVSAYSPDMELTGSWPVPGSASFNTSNSIMVDTEGNTYVRTRVGDPPPGDNMATSGRMFGITGLLRYATDGTVRDSLRPPDIIIDVPRLIASVEGNTSMTNVPWSPQFMWTFSPLGAFVSGRGDAYAINVTTFDGRVTRMEMEGARVPVAAAEREDNERVTTANMRQTDPNWKWNGAPIPDVKPYFKAISVGRDGRIWVSLSQPGEEIPENEMPAPRILDGREFPARKWREGTTFDVFESDGRYVGRVAMPPRTTWRAAKGEHVWAVTRDSLDLEQISRFRIAGAATDKH